MTFDLHSRGFLFHEKELMSTQDTVELHEDNYKTFSLKYRSIIMQACIEIEGILKHICGIPLKDRSDMEIKSFFCCKFSFSKASLTPGLTA